MRPIIKLIPTFLHTCDTFGTTLKVRISNFRMTNFQPTQVRILQFRTDSPPQVLGDEPADLFPLARLGQVRSGTKVNTNVQQIKAV
jgi:hypothetical protein